MLKSLRGPTLRRVGLVFGVRERDRVPQPTVRARPYQLGSVPATLRWPAALALLTVAGWSAALLLTAVGIGVEFDPRADPFGLMDGSAWRPTLVRLVTALGMAVAAVAATAVACHPGWGDARWSRLGRRSVLVAVSLLGVIFADDLLGRPYLADVTSGSDVGAIVRALWVRGLGWAGLVAVTALPFLPSSGALARKLSLGFAVVPFAGWIVGSFAVGGLTAPWLANADWRGDVLQQTSTSLELVLVLFLVWEIVAWTELVADGAAFTARRVGTGRWAVAALLGAKVVWLGAGLAGSLPGFLGGNAALWRASRLDGLASWSWAAVIALVLVVAVSSRRGLAERLLPAPWRPIAALVAVLSLPGLVAGVLDALRLPIRHLVPTGAFDATALVVVVGGAAVIVLTVALAGVVEQLPLRVPALVAVNVCLLSGWLAMVSDLYAESRVTARVAAGLPVSAGLDLFGVPGAIAAHYFVAPGAAFLAAVALAAKARSSMRDGLRQHESRGLAPGAFVLTLAGIALFYVTPRLTQIPLRLDEASLGATGDLLLPQYSHAVYPLAAPWWEGGWNGVAGTFEPVTLDALLTLGLCWLGWRWWRRAEPDWRVLALVLVGSTVLAHSSTLTPGGWLGNRWYYVAFTIPIAWQFLYRGGELTRLSGRRPELAVLYLALIVLLMTVLGYRLLIGALDPSLEFEDLVLGYTRGFSVALVMLPLGAIALARRLRGRVG